MVDKEGEKKYKLKPSISKIESEKVEDENGRLFPSIPREVTKRDIIQEWKTSEIKKLSFLLKKNSGKGELTPDEFAKLTSGIKWYIHYYIQIFNTIERYL